MKTIKSKLSAFSALRGFLTTLSLGIVFFFNTSVALAQEKWGLTLRGGANFPTVKLGDADLKTGFGLEGTVSYRFMEHLGAYAGWGWNKFSASKSFAGNDMDFEETGYTAGLQFIHPIADSKFSYMIGAGGIYNHIETENTDGDIISDSGHGFGWQGEAGISIKVLKYLSITPSVRYRALSREIKIEGVTNKVDLNYISGALGVTWCF